MTTETTTLTRTYRTDPATLWELWTTPAGIASWWAPDGFTTEVTHLDLRPGGELTYTMTAVGPEQVAFMSDAGMPLSTVSRKTFTEVAEPTRLAYTSLVDFVPGHEPYDHLTTVDLTPGADGVTVTMAVAPMHDDVWTERLVTGRTMELDHLAALLAG
jgi:uncharacterized protein YndB with AHSA1/START domain